MPDWWAMPSKTVTVGSRVGLHLRPAQLIAESAATFDAAVRLGRPGAEPVDARSSLLIMTLGAGPGTEVEVTSDDPAAVERIAALVADDLDASGS
jgi:phosphocarrier protein HPr